MDANEKEGSSSDEVDVRRGEDGEVRSRQKGSSILRGNEGKVASV